MQQQKDICKPSRSDVVLFGYQDCFYKVNYFTITGKKNQIIKFMNLLLMIQETLFFENM